MRNLFFMTLLALFICLAATTSTSAQSGVRLAAVSVYNSNSEKLVKLSKTYGHTTAVSGSNFIIYVPCARHDALSVVTAAVNAGFTSAKYYDDVVSMQQRVDGPPRQQLYNMPLDMTLQQDKGDFGINLDKEVPDITLRRTDPGIEYTAIAVERDRVNLEVFNQYCVNPPREKQVHGAMIFFVYDAQYRDPQTNAFCQGVDENGREGVWVNAFLLGPGQRPRTGEWKHCTNHPEGGVECPKLPVLGRAVMLYEDPMNGEPGGRYLWSTWDFKTPNAPNPSNCYAPDGVVNLPTFKQVADGN